MSTTITDILNTETKRLTDKRTAIDNAEAERKRIIALSTSSVERQRAMNIIYIVFAAMLLVIVLIKLLYRFEIVPDTILDLLIAITIAAGIIYCSILYADILRRSDMDFSQIDLTEPAPKTAEQLQKENDNRIQSGDLSAIQSGIQSDRCVGGNCCPADTFFNAKYNFCVPTKVPFSEVPILVGTGLAATFTLGSTNNISTSGLDQQNITDLTTSTNYYYCRKSDGTYAWMPITGSNKMISGSSIINVSESDPNYKSGNRPSYNMETLSTRTTDGFTTKRNSDIEPFSPSEVVDYQPYRL